MAAKVTGGATSAVASSSHAACARFRGTDPIITGRSRRNLATDVGFADTSGKIPEARWLRAATFEKLVRDEKFASEVATTTVGRLDLARPESVAIVHAGTNVDKTAAIVAAAHEGAVAGNVETMVYQLALPFVGFEEASATPALPDFAIVAREAPHEQDGDIDGSWLIMGDAKDYERVRSRIDDNRLLKGFLQVALGAESAAAWSQLPPSMDVHQWGVLAVPRNSFLQPEALVEDLSDHREEVRLRVAERRDEAQEHAYDPATEIVDFVEHLEATFDPGTCTTCTLFSFCRTELRNSSDPTALLIELGIPGDVRPHAAGLVDGSGEIGPLERSLQTLITATLEGVAERTGQYRVDPIGKLGTVNLVLAKSDSAALGVHGVAVQRITADGPTDWKATTFANPMGADTRRSLMTLLGKELVAALAEMRCLNPESPDPIHLVVPEKGTADLLVSIADNMAGIELSRLRWQRDKEMGRPPLTFNGEPADVPPTLREVQRTAVSFLLEGTARARSSCGHRSLTRDRCWPATWSPAARRSARSASTTRWRGRRRRASTRSATAIYPTRSKASSTPRARGLATSGPTISTARTSATEPPRCDRPMPRSTSDWCSTSWPTSKTSSPLQETCWPASPNRTWPCSTARRKARRRKSGTAA